MNIYEYAWTNWLYRGRSVCHLPSHTACTAHVLIESTCRCLHSYTPLHSVMNPEKWKTWFAFMCCRWLYMHMIVHGLCHKNARAWPIYITNVLCHARGRPVCYHDPCHLVHVCSRIQTNISPRLWRSMRINTTEPWWWVFQWHFSFGNTSSILTTSVQRQLAIQECFLKCN